MTTLTPNAIVDLVSKPKSPDFQPLLQVIHLKPVSSGPSVRYRAILSDGQYFVQGMVASQLNQMVETNQLMPNMIIKALDYIVNDISTKKVCILLNIEVIAQEPDRIGQPTDIEKANLAASPPVAASAQPLYPPLHNSTNNGASAQAKPRSSPSSNPYGAARPVSSHAAPIVRATGVGSPVTPIANLNMYNNRWTIQARVTTKSDIRTWSNAKGEGSLFSIELLDASGMDIRATFFREAVEKFYGMLEVGKVYRLSGGRLKVADMKWNTCKSQFEITFDQNSEIHLDEDQGSIQQQNYDFVKIANIEAMDNGKTIDVLAVVKLVADPATLISKKSGQELTKCDLSLVDDSGVEINLTLWGDKAKNAPSELAGTPVVAFRRARVSDYGGKSLSGGDGMQVHPDMQEARALQAWWQSSGSTGAARSLSSSMGGGGGGKMESLAQRKSIASIKDENMGFLDKPDWVSFKATITFLKKDKEGGAWYTACPNAGEPCKNRFKVSQTTDGQWYCAKCEGNFPNCTRRWIFSGVIEDDTSSTWVSFFNEQAETLLGGVTADEVYNKTYADAFDQDAYESYFATANHTEWLLRCKVKNELVNEESRVKTSVVSLQPVDYVQESHDLLAEIAKF